MYTSPRIWLYHGIFPIDFLQPLFWRVLRTLPCYTWMPQVIKSYPNDEFSILIRMIFNVDFDCVNPRLWMVRSTLLQGWGWGFPKGWIRGGHRDCWIEVMFCRFSDTKTIAGEKVTVVPITSDIRESESVPRVSVSHDFRVFWLRS